MNRLTTEHIFTGSLFTALLVLAFGLFGCNEDIEFDGAETGTFQYWCLVSGGEWVGTPEQNICRCGSSDCGHGIVCKAVNGGEFECAEKPSNSKDDITDSDNNKDDITDSGNDI